MTEFRSHRFYLDGENYQFVKRISLLDRKLIITYYLVEENINFIIKKKYPSEMNILLLDGKGETRAKIKLSNVIFQENNLEPLKLDYGDSEIMTIDAILKYRKAELISNIPIPL